MAVIKSIDGMHVVRGGVREYIPPSSVQINGRDLYLFDQATGVLQISADSQVCAFLADQLLVGADTPRDIYMPGGPIGEPVKFTGVRTIRSIAPPEGCLWLLMTF